MSASDEPMNEQSQDRSADGPDPELLGLPAPRRPFRRLTLVSLTLTGAVAIAMASALAGDFGYALQSSSVKDVGSLTKLVPQAAQRNSWVQGEGELAPVGGIRYERPLETDSFRLAPLQGNPKLWVQIRVPAGYENEYFVAPTFFSGRLVPLASLGLRYSTVREAPENAGWGAGHLPEDAWLLIDGETPRANRWVIGLVAMFAAFTLFAAYGLLTLLRSPTGPSERAA